MSAPGHEEDFERVDLLVSLEPSGRRYLPENEEVPRSGGIEVSVSERPISPGPHFHGDRDLVGR
jgi:hypothetical protein